MTARKPVRLEFTDCLGCGKRVATTASLCRHCNTVRTPVQLENVPALSTSAVRSHLERVDPEEDDDSHAALGIGGYGEDDIDEEAESAAPKKNLWWYVALILLIFFSLTALLPWF